MSYVYLKLLNSCHLKTSCFSLAKYLYSTQFWSTNLDNVDK